MTFLVVHGSGGIPNPLFTFSQGCKAVPPGCKAEVVGVEMVNDTNLQIGWSPLEKSRARLKFDSSKCR